MSRPEDPVHALLHPANVALVGASSRPNSMASGVNDSLRAAGYRGAIYPVNSRYDEVWGVRCYPSVSALPNRPDHVAIMVPAANVTAVLEEAAAAGARSATIMSSGIEDRRKLEASIRASGLAVSGPNCMGNFCAASRLMTIDERRVTPPHDGCVAIAGQSGGVVIALYRALSDRGVRTSYLVTTGDELGLNGADYVRYFATRDDVRVILYYSEGLRDGPAFAAAAREAMLAGKRLVVFKVGESARGREAALLHTGSDAGTIETFDSLMASTGAVRAETLDEMVEAAEFLAHANPPPGPRVGVVVFSGGLKGIVADCAQRANIELADFAPATAAKVGALIGTGGSAGNPVDFGPPVGGASFDAYLDVIRAIRSDPNVDLVFLQDELLRIPGSPYKEGAFRRLSEFVAAEPGKPIAIFSMLSHSVTEYGRTLRAGLDNLPFLQEPSKSLRILSRLGAAAREGGLQCPVS